MVFQAYALFPHLTVVENVAFGLRMRGSPKAEIATPGRGGDRRSCGSAASSERRPLQLSGGQQQRVALARALVIRPRILLLDEPFSNLDQKLREEMRDEVAALQRRLGITTLLVTHDQGEALEMSDRIAVMNQGRIEQLGRPVTIYERPATRFVAEFIGNANTAERPRARRQRGRKTMPGPLCGRGRVHPDRSRDHVRPESGRDVPAGTRRRLGEPRVARGHLVHPGHGRPPHLSGRRDRAASVA